MMIQSNRIKVGVPLYCCRTKIHKSLCPYLRSGSKQPPLRSPRSPPPQAKHFPQPTNPAPCPQCALPSPPGSSHPYPKLSRIRTQVRPSPTPLRPALRSALTSPTHIPHGAEGYHSRPPRMSLTVLTDIPQHPLPLSPAAMRSSSPQFSALGRNSCPRTRRDTSR